VTYNNPNKKHFGYKKVATQNKKGHAEKDVKSKYTAKASAVLLWTENKILITTIQTINITSFSAWTFLVLDHNIFYTQGVFG